MNTDSIGVLILAAGESSRMGRPKQILPWKDTTLLGQVVSNARMIKPAEILVVTGAYRKEIESVLQPLEISSIYNPNWKVGMGTGISCGVEALHKKKNLQGILILLADQPQVDSAYLEELLFNFNSAADLVGSQYDQNIGVPAIFGSKYFDELIGLSGPSGAKKILERENTYTISGKSKLIDIDTPQDYERFQN